MSTAMSASPTRVLRLPEVHTRCGVSPSTILRMVRTGVFPSPVRVGVRSIGWYESDVEAWLRSRAWAGR